MRDFVGGILAILQFITGFVTIFAILLAWFLTLDQLPTYEYCCDESGEPYIGPSQLGGFIIFFLFPFAALWGVISSFFITSFLHGIFLTLAVLGYPIMVIFNEYIEERYLKPPKQKKDLD